MAILKKRGGEAQNIILICSSYLFYGWWNWQVCLLLFGISITTYLCGWGIYRFRKNGNEIGCKWKRLSFIIHLLSILVCIGTLAVFKYADFFIESFATIVTLLGKDISVERLNILLPIGISFYVFQSLTYTIDIYKRKIEPTNDVLAYFAFVSFFPQLLSGPIGRASRLISQYEQKRVFDFYTAIRGCWMIAWGLFMKICVADRLSLYVDAVYGNIEMHNGTSIFIAAVLYSIQIYCDFAGYSLMAIGVARLFGIHLDENFQQPYFANSIGDFWRRWHISLSTWFRDYVYIPLGGNRCSQLRNYFNLFVTFLISGLWHGAAWSFVFWGALHGSYQVIDKIRKKNISKLGINLQLKNTVQICSTFMLVTLAWMFFRITDIHTALIAIGKMFSDFGMPFLAKETLLYGLLSVFILISVDVVLERRYLQEISEKYKDFTGFILLQYLGAVCLILWIITFGVFDGGQFIYFQF